LEQAMSKHMALRTRATLVAVVILVGVAVALGQEGRSQKLPVATPAPAPAPAGADAGVAVAPTPPPVAPTAELLVPPAPPPQPTPPPRVEVVFVLDTTGSMGGLIAGAKEKIWSIANFIVSAQPTPEVRIGLIAYRDVGDAYVTRAFGLTGDLDKVQQDLRRLRADGGGDTPEHVSRALTEAVRHMQWTPGAMKMIFLVGDAPPAERGDGYDWRKAVRLANAKEIVIHTVRCGGDGETGAVWKRIASSGNGTFMSIRGDGGVVATRATPMDRRLGELSRELDDTVVIVGGRRAHAAYASKRAEAMPAAPAAAADRAGYLGKAASVGGGAGAGVRLDEADSTDDLASGKRDVTRVAEDELPAEMKGMSAEQRKAYVAKKAAHRKEVLAEMKKVGKERDEWLKANAPAAKKTGFDAAVETAVEKQAGAYGLAY
jgi:hypothetical protein